MTEKPEATKVEKDETSTPADDTEGVADEAEFDNMEKEKIVKEEKEAEAVKIGVKADAEKTSDQTEEKPEMKSGV